MALLVLGMVMTVLSHLLLYMKLLIQVGHDTMPPTIWDQCVGEEVPLSTELLYLAKDIVQVGGKIGLFQT